MRQRVLRGEGLLFGTKVLWVVLGRVPSSLDGNSLLNTRPDREGGAPGSGLPEGRGSLGGCEKVEPGWHCVEAILVEDESGWGRETELRCELQFSGFAY